MGAQEVTTSDTPFKARPGGGGAAGGGGLLGGACFGGLVRDVIPFILSDLPCSLNPVRQNFSSILSRSDLVTYDLS